MLADWKATKCDDFQCPACKALVASAQLPPEAGYS